MFIEESGADLTVTVEGEDYQAEASVDLDDDGLDDTAVVETDDGSIAFTDTNADGQADLMTQLDADGDVVGKARFDEATGEWVHIDLDDDPTSGQTMGPGSLVLETPGGDPVDLGAPTHDTDGDGVKDSVVTMDSNGDTLIVTDSDEDGEADYVTEITGTGDVTVIEHGPDGDWATIERGHVDEHGQYHRESLATETEESGWLTTPDRDPAEVRVDPRTGHWTRG